MLSTWPQAQPLPIPLAEPYIWVTSLVLKAFEFGLRLQLVQAPHLSAEETAAHGGGHSAGRCRTRTIIQSAESQASTSSIHTNVWKILTEGARNTRCPAVVITCIPWRPWWDCELLFSLPLEQINHYCR